MIERFKFGPRAGGDRFQIGHQFAQLGECDADAAACRMKEDRLAVLDTAKLKQEYVGGEVAVGERRRLPITHLVGYFVNEIAVDHQVL